MTDTAHARRVAFEQIGPTNREAEALIFSLSDEVDRLRQADAARCPRCGHGPLHNHRQTKAILAGVEAEVERLRAAITAIADKYDHDYEPDDDDDHPLTILDFNHGEDYAYWMAGLAVNEVAKQAAAALVGAGEDTTCINTWHHAPNRGGKRCPDCKQPRAGEDTTND